MQLNRHFAEHGEEFAAKDARDYENMADRFLTEPRPSSVQECIRKKGDILRFDTLTGAFGVLDRRNVIRTFFKPVPCASLPPPQRALARRQGGVTVTRPICYIFKRSASNERQHLPCVRLSNGGSSSRLQHLPFLRDRVWKPRHQQLHCGIEGSLAQIGGALVEPGGRTSHKLGSIPAT